MSVLQGLLGLLKNACIRGNIAVSGGMRWLAGQHSLSQQGVWVSLDTQDTQIFLLVISVSHVNLEANNCIFSYLYNSHDTVYKAIMPYFVKYYTRIWLKSVAADDDDDDNLYFNSRVTQSNAGFHYYAVALRFKVYTFHASGHIVENVLQCIIFRMREMVPFTLYTDKEFHIFHIHVYV